MACVLGIQGELLGGGNLLVAPGEDLLGSEPCEPAVMVVEVVPVEESPTEGPGVLDTPEPVWERRAIFHRPELALRERIISRGVGSAVALGDAEIGHQVCQFVKSFFD